MSSFQGVSEATPVLLAYADRASHFEAVDKDTPTQVGRGSSASS